TAADGSGTNYPDDSLFMPTSNVTLFANWIPRKYTYTFKAGANGTLSSGGQENQSQFVFSDVPYGTTLPSSVTAVPDSGYAFEYWRDDFYDYDYNETRQDTLTYSSRTITAYFTKLHTVTFNTDGGTEIDDEVV